VLILLQGLNHIKANIIALWKTAGRRLLKQITLVSYICYICYSSEDLPSRDYIDKLSGRSAPHLETFHEHLSDRARHEF